MARLGDLLGQLPGVEGVFVAAAAARAFVEVAVPPSVFAWPRVPFPDVDFLREVSVAVAVVVDADARAAVAAAIAAAAVVESLTGTRVSQVRMSDHDGPHRQMANYSCQDFGDHTSPVHPPSRSPRRSQASFSAGWLARPLAGNHAERTEVQKSAAGNAPV